jgi:hypothetical protein
MVDFDALDGRPAAVGRRGGGCGNGVGAGMRFCERQEVWYAEGSGGGVRVCLGGGVATFSICVDIGRSAVGLERTGVGEGGAARF